jgi:hypothetical protein
MKLASSIAIQRFDLAGLPLAVARAARVNVNIVQPFADHGRWRAVCWNPITRARYLRGEMRCQTP